MKNDEKVVHRNPDIELFGQKLSYPRRWQGVFVVLILSATLVVLSYIILVVSRPENLRSLGVFTGNIQIGVNSIQKQKRFSFGFWTPSVNTKVAMEPFLKQHPHKADTYAWQIHKENTNDIKQKNIEFGELLLEHRSISGFRRYPAVGKATSALKEGWWWIVGMEGNYSEDFFTWFADAYKSHWGLKKIETIYVELWAMDLDK
jgi:hypothetical protein